jgi:serine/threonine protein kinase
MSTSQPSDDSAIPLIHDADLAHGSSFPGLEDAPTQVRPHASLGSGSAVGTVVGAEPPASAQILGARLDHFELLDSIGVGGMGRVFRARDTRLDRLVALKVLSPELSSDPEICRRFEQEAKAAARLDDRHFARVYFFGFDKGLRYIAMEYVEGENIRQKINKTGRLSLPLAINVAIQIAEGLSHAASCGVVHRDIKPSNIILTPDGTAKLVDMGLARNFFQQSSPASELTQAGVTLGTFDYISPEQALDPRDADVRSDIYSLGCTLYHAIAGQPPFSKGSALQKILQHQNDAVPDPRRWVPDLPDAAVAVLMKMLAKDPKDRYQHPVELIEDLRAAAYTMDIPLPEEPVYRPAVRSAPGFWETHLTWILPLGVLLAALFGYVWLDGQTSPRSKPIEATIDADRATPTSLTRRDSLGAETARPSSEQPGRVVDRTVEDARGARPVVAQVVVPAEGDLATAIRQAAPGTRIKLSGKRYVLSDGGDGSGIRGIVIDRDLQIEPESATGMTEIEVRSGNWNGRSGSEGSSLVRIRGESVEMRRLAWIVKSVGDAGVPRSIFGIAGGQLTLEDSFVRVVGGSREEPMSMIQLEGSEGSRRVGSLVMRRCLMHGADEAIRIVSPSNTEVDLVDCAFDHSIRTPFRLEGLGDVTWSMDHVTVRSLETPLFKIQRLGGVRMQARACVFSHLPKGTSTEHPFVDFQSDGTWTTTTDSWWTGRGNLFHGFHPMTISRAGQAIARSLRQARPLGFDETVLLAVDRPEEIWVNPDESLLAASVETGPALADRLRLRSAYIEREEGPFGWRATPWGTAYGSRSATESSTGSSVELVSGNGSKAAAIGETLAVDSATKKVVSGSVMVDPTAKEGVEPNVFVQLSRAIEQASSGVTIEIRVNGMVEVSPASCRGKSITLKSAPGYSPVLVWDATGSNARADLSLFELDGSSKLTVENLAMVVRTDGEKSIGVVSMEAGAEFQLVDSSILIDGNLMKSKALLVKGLLSAGGAGRAVGKVRLTRSTVRTAGSLVVLPASTEMEVKIADAFLVLARPLVSREAGTGDGSGSLGLQIERGTLLLGESLLVGPAVSMSADQSPAVRLSTRDTLLLGYGSSSLLSSVPMAEGGEDLPGVWVSEQTFVAGFASAWGNGVDHSAASLTWEGIQKRRDWLQGSVSVGQLEPFVLGAGGIKTVQVPLLGVLRKLGYPTDAPGLLGVPAQVLPPEPTPSLQR